MDVGHALRILWPRIGILIASGMLAAVAAFVGSGFLPPEYLSRATLLVGQASGAPPVVYQDLLAAQILANTYAALGTTTPVLTGAKERSGISMSVDQLRDRVHVEALRNSSLIVVSAVFPNGEEAAAVANAVAGETAAIGAGGTGNLHVSLVDPAEAAAQPVSPRPLINAVVAAAVGVVASAGFVLFASSMSRGPRRRHPTKDGENPFPAVGGAR